MTRPISTVMLLLAGFGLAGCEMTLPGNAGLAAPEFPPEVIAALPAGVPPSIVFETADGCYAYAIEVTDPVTGFRLRDREGNVICKPGSVPSGADIAPATTAADIS